MNDRDLEHKIHTFIDRKRAQHPDLDRPVDTIIEELR